MERLNPEKLSVEFRPGTTPCEPVIGRKYTLTHSDLTAELYLTVGLTYAYDKISDLRDEVLAKWTIQNEKPILYGYVYVGGQYAPFFAQVRDQIFRRELPLALEALRYGDRELFMEHPHLDRAPIWIYFDSTEPDYKSYEYWGTPGDYR